MKVNKCAMQPFFMEKDYRGKDNEKTFIDFMEENDSILWWYKNGDFGSEFFSISYHSKVDNKERLFYPDWIIKTKNKLFIIDTKKGDTAEGSTERAKALQAWLKGKKGFGGGIAVQDGSNGWKINTNSEYEYTTALKGWYNLGDILR